MFKGQRPLYLWRWRYLVASDVWKHEHSDTASTRPDLEIFYTKFLACFVEYHRLVGKGVRFILGGPDVMPRSQVRLLWWDSRGRFLQENPEIVDPSIVRPRPLPCSYFQVYYFFIIVPLVASGVVEATYRVVKWATDKNLFLFFVLASSRIESLLV